VIFVENYVKSEERENRSGKKQRNGISGFLL